MAQTKQRLKSPSISLGISLHIKNYGSFCSSSQLFLFAIKTYFQWIALTIVGETWLVKGKKASQYISILKGIMGSPNYLGVINNLDPSSNNGPQLSTPSLLVLFFEAVASAWYLFLTSSKRVISISREPPSSLFSWGSWKKSLVSKDIEENPLRLLWWRPPRPCAGTEIAVSEDISTADPASRKLRCGQSHVNSKVYKREGKTVSQRKCLCS